MSSEPQASWKTRPRECRWLERTVLTPCRTGPADQLRALRTGRSLVVKIRPWPWSRATQVPRDCARGRCSAQRVPVAGLIAQQDLGALGFLPVGDGHHGTPRSAPSWASSCCLRSTPPA
jgi:hypothetical protein